MGLEQPGMENGDMSGHGPRMGLLENCKILLPETPQLLNRSRCSIAGSFINAISTGGFPPNLFLFQG
jgi:hypothetical protein